ncbi:class I SAM-dependent methyltransferase [Kribbella sandramycini]|uniref:SAM-dependent methyltransferase n=1 Tax=Kribbella sandramycini TaxID=60450 RepID=A0A841SJE1_9ACTN|nr:SAM-dependent methyltransferase [Kribbella sandramycini]
MDPYGDEDLVELYDVDNADGDDHAYYRALADSLGARKIIDLGCGTGLLTHTLARPGRSVTGIDPSRTMLGYARRTPSSITWIEGDHTALPATADADLVVATGNVLMHLADLPPVFTAIAAALRPGGVFAFESRTPMSRAWIHWTRESTYSERETPFGHLVEWLELISAPPQSDFSISDEEIVVVFDAHNVFPSGEDRVFRNTLYFRSYPLVSAALRDAGLDVRADRNWSGETFTEDARLMVVRATRG